MMVRFVTIRAVLIISMLLLPSLSAQVSAAAASSSSYILPIGGIEEGDPVPFFQAKGLFGEDLSLDNLLIYQKKIVLAFWSMYCAACVEKFDAMVAIQEKYEPEGLLVISVNTDGEYRRGEQAIKDFIKEYELEHGVKINFPVLYDETNWLALAMNVDFLPTIITVDGEGKVHRIYRRFREESPEEILSGIEKIVMELFQEPKPAAVEKTKLP